MSSRHQLRRRIGRGERVGRIGGGVVLIVVAIAGVAGGVRLWAWAGALLASAVSVGLMVIGARGQRPWRARVGRPSAALEDAEDPAGPSMGRPRGCERPPPGATTDNGPAYAPAAPVDECADEAATRPHPQRDEGGELAAACEAVLRGRYVEHLEERHCRVPAWAWVNLLAHGSAEDLENATSLAGDGQPQRWRAARAYLAGEILGVADRGGTSLRDLQRDVLVPLELHLASSEPTRGSRPGDLVTGVLAALEAHERDHRRRRDRRSEGIDR